MQDHHQFWHTPPAALQLAENESHVWRVALAVPLDTVGRLLPLLRDDPTLVTRSTFPRNGVCGGAGGRRLWLAVPLLAMAGAIGSGGSANRAEMLNGAVQANLSLVDLGYPLYNRQAQSTSTRRFFIGLSCS